MHVPFELPWATLAVAGVRVWTFDLSHVNTALAKKGCGQVDGVIGGDLLRPRETIIDSARAALYLRASTTPESPAARASA